MNLLPIGVFQKFTLEFHGVSGLHISNVNTVRRQECLAEAPHKLPGGGAVAGIRIVSVVIKTDMPSPLTKIIHLGYMVMAAYQKRNALFLFQKSKEFIGFLLHIKEMSAKDDRQVRIICHFLPDEVQLGGGIYTVTVDCGVQKSGEIIAGDDQIAADYEGVIPGCACDGFPVFISILLMITRCHMIGDIQSAGEIADKVGSITDTLPQNRSTNAVNPVIQGVISQKNDLLTRLFLAEAVEIADHIFHSIAGVATEPFHMTKVHIGTKDYSGFVHNRSSFPLACLDIKNYKHKRLQKQ